MKTTMKLAIATLSGLLLFSSMNLAAEAATSSTSGSNVKWKEIASKPKSESKADKLVKEELDKIEELVKKNPNDMYIVYVSNDLTKKKTNEVFSMGGSVLEFSTYKDYWNKASTLKDIVLQQPADLPEGYNFTHGEIWGPYSTELSAELKAEAKKLGKQIHWKKVNWTRANSIELEYKSEEHYIKFRYILEDKKDAKASKGFTYESADEAMKKFPKLSKNHEYIVNTLYWTEKGKYYSITTNPDSPLTKEDLIKLAKTMVKK
ncbi:hypothetical protein [Paenibacillus agilis]|uniref:DUF4367 domain-containing protein n=1 Tax=Paenibacillus agilis TaxID=3020863 RepID=A0A559J0Q6_9BACL|nr:hypothetical protein [Paenibacillus agilis]TVX93436.1 hypothetical protein FPZ44_10450 [Paenibacillus agilis]